MYKKEHGLIYGRMKHFVFGMSKVALSLEDRCCSVGESIVQYILLNSLSISVHSLYGFGLALAFTSKECGYKHNSVPPQETSIYLTKQSGEKKKLQLLRTAHGG